MTANPTPTQMLYEGAHDAIEVLSLIRKGLDEGGFYVPPMIEMIDGHISTLEYAIEAHEREQSS